MDKKQLIITVSFAIVLIAAYVYMILKSEKRSIELHNLDMQIAKDESDLRKTLASKSADAVEKSIAAIPDAISRITITQVVEKKPLFTLFQPKRLEI